MDDLCQVLDAGGHQQGLFGGEGRGLFVLGDCLEGELRVGDLLDAHEEASSQGGTPDSLASYLALVVLEL